MDNKCVVCGNPTTMQFHVIVSAPGELKHLFSKQCFRRKDVHILGALWETADFICSNPECRHVTDGYGTYVSNLKKEVERLKSKYEPGVI